MTQKCATENQLLKKQLNTDIMLLRKQLDPLIHSRFYRIWRVFTGIPVLGPPHIPKLKALPANCQELAGYRDALLRALGAVKRSPVFRLRMFFHNIRHRADRVTNSMLYEQYRKAWNTLTRQKIEETVQKQIQKRREQFGAPVRRVSGKTPFFSILILHHCNPKMTLRCIDSIQKNSGSVPYEILILNNGSTQPILHSALCKGRKRISSNVRVLESRVNLSFSAGNNYLSRQAHGSHLVFLNNDIEVLPGWLEAFATGTNDYPNSILGAKLIYPEYPRSNVSQEITFPALSVQHEGITFVQRNTVIGTNAYLPENRRKGDHPFSPVADTTTPIAAVSAACMCISKTAFTTLGNFDEGYLYGYEDVDLCLTAWENGMRVFYIPHCVAFHYEFGTQDTIADPDRKDSMRRQNEVLFLEKWNEKVAVTVLLDRMQGNAIWSDEPLRIGIAGTGDSDTLEAIREYITAGKPGVFQLPVDNACEIVLTHPKDNTDYRTVSSCVRTWKRDTKLLSVIQAIKDEISTTHNHLLPRPL
ncbi:MAG: glycosyltransferase family 2 protein [Patescibacteria group bacterium]|nr:glycosyltransferase family 2 protein [Patescibacteria group bacterium]